MKAIDTLSAKLGRLAPSTQSAIAFFGSLLLILALKWSTLTQPPVWDGSMSVFPAAITLAENGFDLADLLARPGYNDGGPNVHAISIITWITALAIMVIGDGPALFPALHLLHFLITAATMTGLFAFGRRLLGARLAALATLAALLFPLVLTQAGYVYLEMPLLATGTFALLCWIRGKPWRSVAWVTAAVLIKGTGIILAGAIGGLALLSPRRSRRSVAVLLAAAIVPTTVLGLAMSQTPGFGGFALRAHYSVLATYLMRMPDVLVLLLAYVLVTVLVGRQRDTPQHRSSEDEGVAEQTQSITLLVVCFLGFFILMPVLGKASDVLPRYFVLVVPFVIVGLASALRHRVSDRACFLLLLGVIGWSAVNHAGALYPDNDVNDFPLAERSAAYRDLLALQQKGIDALVAVPPHVAVFYDQPTHYKLSYPLMGYAKKTLDSGHSILHQQPYRRARLRDFPAEFYMLYQQQRLGGSLIKQVWEQAEADPARKVTVTRLAAGAFGSSLIHVAPKR